MSSRRKQRDNFVQSLFPFLAVLLSTMGALVLLLMLIVNQAQANAKQMATEKKMQIEDAETKLDILRGSFEEKLDDRRLDIERKRLTLQHLEKHISELLDELKSLERTATLLESKQTQDKAGEEENDREISKLEKQLVDANIDLKKKLDNPVGDKPIFAIIPYQGTNGTHRRPIYLECTDKGVIIQPEGVLIGIADLRPPYGPGNPLDAAIRTVRSRFVPASGALTSTAYPLLVVRPSGVRTYAMARQAMTGWDDQFGYELIDEQLELTFPESEPGIAAEIQQALVLARDRQAALVMAMPAKFRQYINQGQGGSSGPDDSLDFADDGGDLGDEWAGGGSAGSAGGFGSGAGSSSGGSQGFRGGVANSQNGPGGTSGLRATGAGGNGAGASAVGNMQSRSGELGFAGSPNGGQFNSGQTGRGQAGAGQAGSGQAGAGGVGANGQSGGTSYFAHGGNGQTPAGDGSYFASGSGGAPGADANGFSQGEVSSTGNESLADSSSRTGANGGTASGGSGTSSGAGAGGGGAGPGGPAGMVGGGSSSAPSGSGGGAGAASMGGMSSMAGNPANDPTASPSGDSQQQAGAPSLNMDMTRNSSQAGQASQKSEPVSRQRGRNWAWSEGPPSKTAVVRTIRVVCYDDRWVLMQDNAASNQVTIAIGQSPQQSAERLAKAITDRVAGWGIALGGGYWKPELVVDVAPGAEARCAQLERLLEGSGLTVKRRAAK